MFGPFPVMGGYDIFVTHMDGHIPIVLTYEGFLNSGYPRIIHFRWEFLMNKPSIWGYMDTSIFPSISTYIFQLFTK